MKPMKRLREPARTRIQPNWEKIRETMGNLGLLYLATRLGVFRILRFVDALVVAVVSSVATLGILSALRLLS